MAFFLCLVCAFYGHAQIADGFSDGDFTANPEWSGDNAVFTIDNFQLRLQAPAAAGTAYLSTTNSAINDGVWEFRVMLGFNPSSSNYARVYLVSDQAGLNGPLNGYFVMVGDTDDEVSLYRQAGTSLEKIVDGANGRVGLPTVDVAIKVVRDHQGNWELFSDVGATGAYTSEGTAFDNVFKASAYFGVVCTYTATRSDKFYFDDVVVTGNPYVDVDPPILDSIEVLSSNEVTLHFNEALDPVSALDPLVYSVGTGHPDGMEAQPDEQSVRLVFGQHFQNGLMHTLTINGLKDLAGNALSTTGTFLYFQLMPVGPKDIIFTEIFPDPSPQVSLPDAEYVEVHNRSPNPVNLSGWQLSDGSSVAVLPEKIILPNGYWVVTSLANAAKFGMGTPVVGATNFPTLNNTDDILTLKTPLGKTIDSLGYDLSWYRNIDKQEGGWSLELIDPDNICAEEENWTASESEQGGTPGKTNSVFANKPDLTGPRLISATVVSGLQLLLSFNEKLENPISGQVVFSIVPFIKVSDWHFETRSLRSVTLNLAAPLATRQLYTITVDNLFDCAGNNIASGPNTATFAIPEQVEAGDILINEILFNPRPNGVDFVELYNHSDKYINLKHLAIGNLTEGLVENPKPISVSDLIMPPHEYCVLTPDPVVLKVNYPQGKEEKFISVLLPSFPDDAGSASLSGTGGFLVDALQYDKDFHSPFIKEEEGVSLERVSFSAPNTRDNWASASATVGFATPGYINSNFRAGASVSPGDVEVSPPVIALIPGGPAFAQINFQFDQPGLVANVNILDHQGRLIKVIANNATLGTGGSFRWDGDMEDGTKARSGYYVVWFEVFNAAGNVKTYRKRVIIATR